MIYFHVSNIVFVEIVNVYVDMLVFNQILISYLS